MAPLREWLRRLRPISDPPVCQIDQFSLRINSELQQEREAQQSNEEALRRVRDKRNVKRLEAELEYLRQFNPEGVPHGK